MNSPAIFGSLFRKETAPCPRCQNHIAHGEMNCSHCGHELTDLDISELKQYILKQNSYGRLLGILIIPAAIILLTMFFMLFE